MIRIKCLHDAAIRDFKTNYPKYERDAERNAAKMERLFNDTLNGIIKGFYLISNSNFKAYHRSTKEDGKIQLSSGFYKNGELFPCYDCQFTTFVDMQREGWPSGYYDFIK